MISDWDIPYGMHKIDLFIIYLILKLFEMLLLFPISKIQTKVFTIVCVRMCLFDCLLAKYLTDHSKDFNVPVENKPWIEQKSTLWILGDK